MSATAPPITGTAVDTLQYQSDLVRAGTYEPIGRMMKLSVGDSAKFKPPVDDKLFDRFGRFIDLRHCMLPLALSPDDSQLLVTARLLRLTCPKCAAQFLSGAATTAVCPQCLASFTATPEVKLPDLPDPFWTPASWTQDEVEGRTKPDPAKTRPPILAQFLTNRCEQDEHGQPSLIARTNYMVFQPVVRIAFQAESAGKLMAAAGLIDCKPGRGGLETAFLVDYRTGECHFYGGTFLIARKE
ncbi:MAG: hypothetical protein ACREQ5_09155 [Candidatus Dormibacteria bacterium]